VKKEIAAAGKKQDRDELKILAKKLVRFGRNRRELEKYQKFLDGFILQTQRIQMATLTSGVTETLLECLDSMSGITDSESLHNNMMEFEKRMTSIGMGTEILGDYFKEDEDNVEDEDELSGEVKEIIDDALASASHAILDKLPSVSLTQPRNNNNNNNNNNNSIKHSSSNNPHNILQEIDKYTKT